MPFADGLDMTFLLGTDTESVDTAGRPTYGWTEIAKVRGTMRSLRGSEANVADDRKTKISHYIYLNLLDVDEQPYVIAKRQLLIPAEVYDVSLPRYVVEYHNLRRDLFWFLQVSEVH